MYVTMNVGETRDLWIEDHGTGITDYQSFVSIGHDEDTEEYKQRQADPDFLGQIGIGINSYCSLSEIGTAEFYSVSQDDQGRTSGLVAKMRHDEKTGYVEFEDPPERPDSKYVLDHVGLRTVIKNMKQYTKEKVREFLSETFARKLGDYPILLKDAQIDTEFEQVQPPVDFCSSYEEEIGKLSNGSSVYADLYSAEKIDDCKIDILVKKVRHGEHICEYKARGYVWCNGLEFTPDRDRLVTGSPLYQEFIDIIDKYCINRGFEKKSKIKDERKNDKTLKKIAESALAKFCKRHPDMLQILGIKQQKQQLAAGNDTKAGRGWKERERDKGSSSEGPREHRGRRKKHKHHHRLTELAGNQDSDFDLKLIRAPRTKNEDILLMDLQERAIVINLSHESAADKISSASKDWMHALVSRAIVEASYPDISREERNMLFGEMFTD